MWVGGGTEGQRVTMSEFVPEFGGSGVGLNAAMKLKSLQKVLRKINTTLSTNTCWLKRNVGCFGGWGEGDQRLSTGGLSGSTTSSRKTLAAACCSHLDNRGTSVCAKDVCSWTFSTVSAQFLSVKREKRKKKYLETLRIRSRHTLHCA